MKKYLFLLLFLTACGHTPEKEVITEFIYVDVVCEDFGHINGINPLPVIFVKGIDDKGYRVLGLRGDMYSNLAINSADTIRYILEQNKAIDYYKKCISDHNAVQDEGPPS